MCSFSAVASGSEAACIVYVVMCMTSHELFPWSKRLLRPNQAAKSGPSRPAACAVTKQVLTCIAISMQKQTHSGAKDALDLWLRREAMQGFAETCGVGYCRFMPLLPHCRSRAITQLQQQQGKSCDQGPSRHLCCSGQCRSLA